MVGASVGGGAGAAAEGIGAGLGGATGFSILYDIGAESYCPGSFFFDSSNSVVFFLFSYLSFFWVSVG